MKKITFLLTLFIASIGYSQVVLEDFEGTAPTVGGFEGLASATVTAGPVDGSNTALELITSTTGQGWQGGELIMQSNLMDLSTDNTVKIDVYATTAFTLFAKVEDKVNDTASPASAADEAHTGSGWETLTFTFNESLDGTAVANGQYSQIAFFPNWNGSGWNDPVIEITVNIDNVTANAGDAIVPPSSQVVLEDFEGTAPTVGGFEGLASATVTAGPVDGSNTALELITSTTGQGWQGGELIMQSNLMDLSTDNTVKIDVYATTAFTLFAKVEDKVNDTASPASAADEAHTGSGWETLTFTFNESLDGTAVANGQYSQIAFFPNWNGSGWNDPVIEITVNIDNVTANAGDAITVDTCSNGIQDGDETGIDCGGSCGPCPAEPTDAPITPITRNDWDVISIYSDAYTSTGLTNVTWDDSEATEVNIADNNVLKADFGNFLGTELTTGGVDASDMTHFHMDYWIADDFAAGQVFNPKLSNHADFNGETGSKLYTIALGADDNKKWLSLDVELGADFERNNILQFLLTTSATVNVGYMDNIYMYRAATAGVSDNELLNVSMYPNPAADRLNISAANTIKNASIFNILGKKVMSLEINKNSESIDVSSLASGIYLIKYQLDTATGTAKFIKE